MNHAIAQQAFAAALLDPARVMPAGLRVAPGIDPARRFAVHRNNVVVALVDALAAAFPVTQALVGEVFFRAMARERVRIDPPRSPVIADYGDGFADFIAQFAPAAGVPYLADVARLECLRGWAYHAADAVPVAPDAYRALVAAPERLAATVLTLHPACGWLRSDYAVHSLWSAHQGLDDLRDADLRAIALDTPEAVLVTRPQWNVLTTVLPDGGVAWLDALRGGATLGEAATGEVAPQRHAACDTVMPAAQFEIFLSLIIRHGLAVALHSPLESMP